MVYMHMYTLKHSKTLSLSHTHTQTHTNSGLWVFTSATSLIGGLSVLYLSGIDKTGKTQLWMTTHPHTKGTNRLTQTFIHYHTHPQTHTGRQAKPIAGTCGKTDSRGRNTIETDSGISGFKLMWHSRQYGSPMASALSAWVWGRQSNCTAAPQP